MIHFPQVLETLSNIRPVFRSEADFKHAIVGYLQLQYPNLEIRREKPFSIPEKFAHIDIFTSTPLVRVAIELLWRNGNLHQIKAGVFNPVRE